jgi:hypothetical protein
MYKFDYVNIKDLALWTENPRIDPDVDSIDEITDMLANKKSRIIPLAESIMQYGLLEPIAVLRIDNKKYLVKEGNRRVISMLLLSDPELIKDYEDSSVYKSFKSLSENVKTKLYTSIPAMIYEEKDADLLEIYIKNRHMGINEGRGLIPWDSIQIERYKVISGSESPILTFFNMLEQFKILTRKEINKIYKTNWERVLASKMLREYFGFYRHNGFYNIVDNNDLFRRKLTLLVNELDGKGVKIIYDKTEQRKLIDKIDSLINDTPEIQINVLDNDYGSSSQIGLPLNPSNAVNPDLSSDDTESVNINITPIDNANQDFSIPSKFNTRNTLLPLSVAYINTNSTKMKQIIDEANRLSVNNFPISASILFRTLLEHSSKLFGEKFGETYSQNSSLQSIIQSCLKVLKQNDMMTKENHSMLHNLVNNPNTSTISLLNGVIHQNDTYPTKDVLLSAANSFESYLKTILAEI